MTDIVIAVWSCREISQMRTVTMWIFNIFNILFVILLRIAS